MTTIEERSLTTADGLAPDGPARGTVLGLAGLPAVAAVCLSALLVAAHFLRAGEAWLALACVASPALLLSRRRWPLLVLAIGLEAGAAVWLTTTLDLVELRASHGAPWLRLAAILGGVTLFTALTPLVLLTPRMLARHRGQLATARASAGAFVLTAVGLGAVLLLVPRPMLLPDRFLPGSGWLLVLGLSVYAAWVTEVLLDRRAQRRWRPRLWLLFSVVFFAQLAIGLAGAERFLMSGDLHLPIPALVAAGPVYRGGGLFMVGLFAVTVLLVGPAWCSHLCYFGAWDGLAASRARRPEPLPSRARRLRLGLLVLVLAVAAGLNLAGAPPWLAGGVALLFGLGGVAVMVLASRRRGTMLHCAGYCPLGLVADLLGKVSPFRVRIGGGCDACGACARVCRYGALDTGRIREGRPGLTCSLCGDCQGVCRRQAIGYRFLGLEPARARALFVVLVASLHAVFLGVARI